MTGTEGESVIMLLVIFHQLLKLCGVIHNFENWSVFVLRRMDHSLFSPFSDCAAGWWVNYLSYNTITPTVYWLVPRVYWYFRSLIPFGTISKSFDLQFRRGTPVITPGCMVPNKKLFNAQRLPGPGYPGKRIHAYPGKKERATRGKRPWQPG